MKVAARAVLLALFAGALIVAIGPAVVPPPNVSLPGGTPVASGEVSPAAGEAIFWGKGRCFTCHSVGDRGGERRCPNLGASDDQPAIGARAAARAEALRGARGADLTPTDYLVESLVNPTAYVVAGFKPEMPAVMKPPLALSSDEVRALVAYLQSLGGAVNVAAIRMPALLGPASAAVETWAPYLAGDPARGEQLFFDPKGVGCAACHRIGERGGRVGPELTHLGAIREQRQILESILDPSAQISNGFEGVEIETRDHESVVGTLAGEDETSVTLALASDTSRTIAKTEIVRRDTVRTSLMPGNFAELLRVTELHDLLAYLTAQR